MQRNITAEEAANYTLANIFAQVNGQKDYGTAWDVKADPSQSDFVSYIVKYEAESTSYAVGDTVVTVKDVKSISGNSLAGWVVSDVEVEEVFYDAEGNEVANITAAAGEYVAKLLVEGNVVAELAFEVVAGNPTETKTYSFALTNLDSSIVTADKQALVTPMELAPNFTATGAVIYRWNADKGITSIEVDKQLKGSVVFTVEGKATVVVSASSTGGSNESPIAIQDATGTIIENKEGLTFVAGTSKTTLTYELSSGTYSLVSPSDPDRGRGFRLYSIIIEDVVEIESAPTVETVTVKFNPSTLDTQKVNSGTAFEEIFTFYGKAFTDPAAPTQFDISSITATDGTNEYTRVIKLSGGKAAISGESVANAVAISVAKAGQITVVVSQKNAAASLNSGVKLALFDASGAAIYTHDLVLAGYDETVNTITFDVAEAGTYYIGAVSNGFYLYAISYSYEEVVEVPVEKNLVVSHTVTADDLTVGEGLYGVAWGQFGTLSGDNETKTWKVNTSTKKITDVNGTEVTVTNRIQSAGSQRFLLLDFSEYDGQVKVQLYVSAQGTSERTIAIVDALGTTLDSYVTTASDMFVIEIVLEAGSVYKVTTSNGYNFHAINFIGLE